MDEFRGWKLVLLTFCIFLIVTLSGFGFDRMLNRDGVNRTVIIASANALTGLVVAGLFLEFTRNIRNRRRLVQARLEVIADMNHHIRNALQVITYGTATHGGKRETEMMRESIHRIEWALREVLPGYLPETHIPRDPVPSNSEHHHSA
jgi:hypothetical protein